MADELAMFGVDAGTGALGTLASDDVVELVRANLSGPIVDELTQIPPIA